MTTNRKIAEGLNNQERAWRIVVDLWSMDVRDNMDMAKAKRDTIEAALDEAEDRGRQSQEHYVTELHQRISILEGKTGFFTNNMAGMVADDE